MSNPALVQIRTVNTLKPEVIDWQLYNSSWTSYICPTIALLVFSGLGILLAKYQLWLGAIPFTAGLCVFSVQISIIRSLQLYTDEVGVWVSSGIFPWAKGTTGLKWKDLESATFSHGLIYWLTKSYTVTINHRFDKSKQIVVTQIHRGNRAVVHINKVQKQYLQFLTTGQS